MLIKLFKLGEDEVVTTFALGSHVLGRGASLKCNDKRISRNHATIEITLDNVTLTSTHVNPCFLKAAESKTITILKKDTSTQLNDGDTFALLPDDFWFRVKVCEDVSSEIKPNDETFKVTSKRCSDDRDDDALPDKKIKTEIDNGVSSVNNFDATEAAMEITPTNCNENAIEATVEGTETNHNEGENATAMEATGNSKEQCKSEEEKDLSVKGETNDSDVVKVQQVNENVPQTDQVTTKLDQDNQPSANTGDENPGTSNPKPLKREKCWYGALCYRKNQVHRQEYTHPGDSDYESDPDDDRPTCSYGAACYRKNKDHRREYKHPPQQPPSKQKRNRKKVDRLNMADSEEMREFDDSEDPFINDDDSDEYVGGSDEEDSDWEDSQEADEDGENVKRLVKEANRFVKK